VLGDLAAVLVLDELVLVPVEVLAGRRTAAVRHAGPRAAVHHTTREAVVRPLAPRARVRRTDG